MEKRDIEDLKKEIGHIATWRLRNSKERRTVRVRGKLEEVTEKYFVISGKFYPFHTWIIAGASQYY